MKTRMIRSRGKSETWHGHARALAMCLIVSASMLCGCKSTPKDDAQSPKPAPTYEEIARAQNGRVEVLKRLYAPGAIELRWRDRDGNHFESCRMELWVQLPRNTALRVEKLGEVLLWLGSNDERYWLFQMTGKQKVLRVGHHDAAFAGEQESALNVRPLALLDLMSLTPLPADLSPPPEVTFDARHRAWAIKTQGRGGPMRMYFDPQTLLPSRVETLSPFGKPVLWSSLKRYESATMKGMSPLAFPRLATNIDIETAPDQQAAAPDNALAGTVKIAIENASGAVDDAVLARVFDLHRLVRGFNPSRIEGELPPQPGATASGQ
jgi:hypothetical protein